MTPIQKKLISQLTPTARKFVELYFDALSEKRSNQLKSKDNFQDPTLSNSWLPIERFKSRHAPISWGERCTKSFRSSGTTAEVSSESRFSPLGLELYRFQAIWHFEDMCQRLNFSPQHLVSLISTPQEWPDSSLAQMIAWFSEFWNTTYFTPEEFADNLPQLAADQTTLILGTGFHFVHLLDTYGKLALPPSFFVLETGGTKGKTREISKEELYTLFEEKWGLKRERILTEYGMSELACQAYYLKPGEDWLCFPNFVDIKVQTGIHSFSTSGIGNLVVNDPLRIDLPLAIRTQDVCELRPDQSFRLLGRAESAPLKGCSIKSEHLLMNKEFSTLSSSTCEMMHAQPSIEKLTAHSLQLHDYLTQETVKNLMTREFDSVTLATHALQDLRASLPQDGQALRKALEIATLNQPYHKTWLIIPAATHSQAALYPLALLSALGCEISLRETGNPTIQAVVNDFIHFLRYHMGATIEILPKSWRIDTDKHPLSQEVLVYGSNETLTQIRSRLHKRICGFGDTLAYSVISQTTDLAKAAKDLFSLRRSGCMSARALFIGQNLPVDDITTHLQEWLHHSKITLTPSERAGALAEASAQQDSSARYIDTQNAIFRVHQLEEISLSDSVAESRFLIPLIHFNDKQNLLEWFRYQTNERPDIHFLLSGLHLDADIKNLETRSLGSLNINPWNGLHCKRNLFIPA